MISSSYTQIRKVSRLPKLFDLYVGTDAAAFTADLRLLDSAGNQLAWRQLRLTDHPASRWEGLFDLRRYVQRFAGNLHPLGEGEPLDEEDLVRELGVFLGCELLGGADADPTRNLMAQLGKGIEQRTLRVRLPTAAGDDEHLAAAFSRVPWEIARGGPAEPTLSEKGVLVRSLAGDQEPTTEPLALGAGESLRVLVVFAEAPGSRPLAARLERQRLLELFYGQIYPRRRVEVDVLCYGVTRERLVEQINSQGGYHIVHWSGHGHLNLLELYSEGKEPSRLSGQELVDLFSEAGGYVPRLVFLSACHSGGVLRLQDWDAFQAVLEGREPDEKAAAAKTDGEVEALTTDLTERPGYTGTARALLDAGIPTVVAMRYEVGDEYARDLAAEFYERLLADQVPKRPDAALGQARRALLEAERRGKAHGYAACDHATPVLYGAADPGFVPPQGRTQVPSFHPHLRITELHSHRAFVGRTWELARLGARWLAAGTERPVAVVRGLGGLGKTALAAETLGLWHERFRWVFPFQAKPVALTLDDFLRQLHATWMEQQGDYAAKVAQYPAEAIWRPAVGEFTGAPRQETLGENLVAALQAEPVLLVLDNFETCLVPQTVAGGTGHACQDPGWDALLAALAGGLVGSNSRVLLTSRWPLAALAGAATVEDLSLGPLPPGEAALYVRSHPVLRKLAFEQGDAGRALVLQLVQVSRGHPLLLDRLARLAEQDTAALEEAIRRLEKEGLGRLPEFFAADPRDAKERKYLEDALAGSIDLLLERVGADARRALWVLSLANEPVTVALWREVWTGRDLEEEQLEQLRGFLALLEQLPPEARAEVPPLSDDLKAKLNALGPAGSDATGGMDFDALRDVLVQSGLVTEQRDSEADQNPEDTCHELVRERILAWMDGHSAETGGLTREQVWTAYGDRFIAVFKNLVEQNQLSSALESGSRALRYVVRAGAFKKLRDFAGRLVTSTRDPRILQVLLPELERAAAAAPPGEARWSALTFLADALRQGGRPDTSLAPYAAAAIEAEEAQAWGDLAWITGNWANSLHLCGLLEAAQQKHRESARYEELAGRPAVNVLGSELEALRIDLMLDRAAEAVPEIESRLVRLRNWWEATRRGEDVPEASDPELLGRALIAALDIARQAHVTLKELQPTLDRIDEIIAVKRARGASEHEIAADRFNRYSPLLRLGRLDAAQLELEHCLDVFEQAGDERGRSMTLSALADLSDEMGDPLHAIALERRALAICNTLPGPEGRAISHNNLAYYLELVGEFADAGAHELAALLYRLATGRRDKLEQMVRNHVRRLYRARQSGREHDRPSVAGLLARPDFASLRDWLAAGQMDLAQLQQAEDAFVAQCREMAEKMEAEEP